MSDKSVQYRLEWLLAKLIIWIFERLGQRKASAFGGWLFRKIGPLLSVHKLARRNMKQSLPELDDAAIEKNLMRMWDNLGRNVGEIPFIGDILEDPEAIEVVGGEYLDTRKSDDKAAFFATAHYGPWELVGNLGVLTGVKTMGIYRAANNPLIDSLFQEMRKNDHYEFSPKGPEGARSILSNVRAKANIVLLNDQKLNAGVAIPFFGRDAMTAPAIAEIALKKGIPIYPTRNDRLGEGKFRLTVYPPLNIEKTGEHQQDVENILIAINKAYEDWIRERPDHWFWVHNRWIDN